MIIDVIPASETFFTEKTATLLELFTAWKPTAFFAHPVYQQQWWQFLEHHRPLKVLTFQHQGELVGWAAFYQDEASQTWRLVGAKEESDYLDIVIKPGLENEVCAALVTYWHSHQADWGKLKLESLPNTSLTLGKLPAMISNLGGTATSAEQDVCPVIALPATWDAYLQGLDGSFAKRLKRLQRDSGAEDEISYRLVERPEELAQQLPSFIELHKASGSEKAGFWSPEREEFFNSMPPTLAANQPGLVKLYFLDVNNDPAAAILIFDYLGQFLLYNSGFNQYRYGHLGVGTLLVAQTIKEAISLQKTRYDFMRGDEGYKFEFGAVSEPVFDINISL